MSQKSFDIIKASFYLIAFVIGAHVFTVLIALADCIFYTELLIDKHLKCDPDGRLGEALSAALASALAFAGGRSIPSKNDEGPK